jgi:hypothetical protein
MQNVSLVDGHDGLPGNAAKVDDDGRVATAAGPTRTVVNRVAGSVGTSSAVVLSDNPRRVQLQVQNLHASNALHVSLASSAASTQDYRLDPGAVYSFPPGVVYTGEVQLVATEMDTPFAGFEFEEQDV